ncbi:hypothetical protein DFS34DRAFT_607642 [Phlyctochytrium arcticum]|nr:hypothetical protein DFS34DRAFT_607642 [Phlyctochytrium arcticum]
MISVDGLTVLLASAIVLVGSFVFKRKAPDVHPAVFREQAYIGKTRNEGETAIIRNTQTPHGVPLMSTFDATTSTVYEMFNKAINDFGPQKFMAERHGSQWAWLTFEEAGKRAKQFGAGLLQLKGIERPQRTQDTVPAGSQMVGLFMGNCPEWIITDYACTLYGLVTVPLYDTFDVESLQHIISQTGMTSLIAHSKHINKIFDIAGRTNNLKNVILADVSQITPEIKERADALQIFVQTIKEAEQVGSSNPAEQLPPRPEDVFTICYTSGTTGLPKGVMITHQNIVSGGAGMLATIPEGYKLNSADRHLSYLPLSHMFERIVFHTLAYLGCEIGFFSGDIAKLFDDIDSFKPTLFPTVPRLLSRLYDKVNGTIAQSGIIKKTMFNLAYEVKKQTLRNGIITKTSFWDKLVFGKLQARIGGRVRMMLTGAAPISPDVIEFVRIVMGCQVLEGYGQTEAAAAGFVTKVGDYEFPWGSHVGTPFPSVEAKLVDVPSMEYYATDKPHPRGEICFRGPLVMKGYFKEPKMTAETVDKDGWLHTGDVGELLPNCTIKITDRVKNIFKLSQGEYIAPEKIEQKIKTTYVAQLFVYGDSLKSALVCVVVPDAEAFVPWVKSTLGFNGSLEEACNSIAVRDAVMKDMVALGKKAGLLSLEIPKAIVLKAEPMSVENGLLTPTFKTKRNIAKRFYQKELDAMYEELGSK